MKKPIPSEKRQDVDLLLATKELIDECRKHSGTNARLVLLEKAIEKEPLLAKVLHFTYNPFIRFHLTTKDFECGECFTKEYVNEKTVRSRINFNFLDDKIKEPNKYVKFWTPRAEPFFACLELLHKRIYTGKEAKKVFIASLSSIPYILYDTAKLILSKNLGIGLSVTSINKILKKMDNREYLIPEMNVALGVQFEKSNFEFEKEETWYASRKFDGLRCLCHVTVTHEFLGTPTRENYKKMVYDEVKPRVTVELFSRKGIRLTALRSIELEVKSTFKRISPFNFEDFWLDGEITINSKGDEFNKVVSLVKRKEELLPTENSNHPVFHVFDVIPNEGFVQGHSGIAFNRRVTLLELFKKYLGKNKYLKVVAQHEVNNKEDLEDLVEYFNRKGYEGTMLRRGSSFYEGKRTNDLIKIKKFNDAEFEIVSLNFGDFEARENGKIVKLQDVMTSAIINYDGNPVSVGSGWSLEQRKRAKKEPYKFIGKTITVKWFEDTTNKSGTKSMRFPTMKHFHDLDSL